LDTGKFLYGDFDVRMIKQEDYVRRTCESIKHTEFPWGCFEKQLLTIPEREGTVKSVWRKLRCG
jgi:hypothetical protein